MFRLTMRALGGAAAINGMGFMLASLATVAWYFLLVRHYVAEESGQLLLAFSVAGLVNLLDFGVSLGLVRVISASDSVAYPHSPQIYFRSAISVTCSIELVVGFIGVLFWQSQSPHAPSLLACACIVGFAIATEGLLLCVSLFKGLCDFRTANVISTGSTLVVYGIGSACLAVGLQIWTLFVSMTILQLSCAAIAVHLTHSRLKSSTTPSPSWPASTILSVYGNLLRISVAYFPQLSTGIFFMHVQRFLIVRYAGLDSVAVISFAYSLATRIHSVANAFLEVIFPMAEKLRAAGLQAVSFSVRLGLISAAAYALVAAAVASVTWALLPGMISVLIIFCIGVMFAVALVPAFHLLNGSGASKQVSFCSLLSPFIFASLVPILQIATPLQASLLLPTAYAIAMGLMLPHVTFLVMRHARHFDLNVVTTVS